MIQIEQQVSLAGCTSFRIGGPAHYYVRVAAESDVIEALAWAADRGLRTFVLGRGTNVLISDRGWPGLVLDTTGMNAITWDEDTAWCAGGALLHAFVKEAVDRGLAGVEYLAGIPGAVGGGVVMNAGAFGQNISDCLLYAEGIDMTGGECWRRPREELQFGYRHSSLKEGAHIVTKACFLLPRGDAQTPGRFRETLRRRAAKQPLDLPNCGSVFKRPAGDYAGRLIEKNRCMGLSVGGAMVSRKHANFIVNTGNACAEDVRRLIAAIQQRVFESDQTFLEPEVLFVGEFDHDLFAPETAGRPAR